MSGAIFAGDDVGAIVIEVEGLTTKAGYAGEDAPSVVIPTEIGYTTIETNDMDVDGNNIASTSTKRRYEKQRLDLLFPKEDMHTSCPVVEGEVVDWDSFEKLLDTVFDTHLHCNIKEHPVMFGDEVWSSSAQREKITELMFEKYNVPAYYLMRKPVLSAFASGKPSCVVFDIGYSGSTAVPVLDGYVLNKCAQRSKLGGAFMTNFYKKYLQDELKMKIIPKYQVKKKGEYDEDKNKRAAYIPSNIVTTKSYHNYCVRQEIDECIKIITRCSEKQLDESAIKHIPNITHEFSNGISKNFGPITFRGPEVLFNPQTCSSLPGVDTFNDPLWNTSMQQMIVNAVQACDIDIHQTLSNHILCTGGVTEMNGFTERLSGSLYDIAPEYKLKVSSSVTERRFASWIGGSIVASLGAFQQKWISKKEYNESGAVLVEKKCP